MKIINKANEILNAIPELKELRVTEADYVSYENFEKRMKRIEKHNLSKFGKSLSFSSIKGYFKPAVLELQKDREIIVINKKAYRLIRNYVTSEAFVMA